MVGVRSNSEFVTVEERNFNSKLGLESGVEKKCSREFNGCFWDVCFVENFRNQRKWEE